MQNRVHYIRMPEKVLVTFIAVLAGLVFFSEYSTAGLGQLGDASKPNRLIHEHSPYLKAHAYNLVDWYPWGDEPFEAARKRNVPVLLSIGFSTCYWCHLMSRDCFSDPEIAEFLNRNFVSIKIDREERPDIDQIYASFVEASTGKFGWPMTVFLTADRKPIFGGGFYEPKPFLEQIQKISGEWKRNSHSVQSSADKLADLLKRLHAPSNNKDFDLDLKLLDSSYQWYTANYDRQNGGFGKSSKYTRPDDFGFLLRYHFLTSKRGPLTIVRDTLEAMGAGAIRDHLGGGFFRYSIDPEWRYPHTEKLLFFQAQMAISYLECYQLTSQEGFLQISSEILDYLLRKLWKPDGSFASSEDSVSGQGSREQGLQQGIYYFWKWSELQELLGRELGRFSSVYPVAAEGNFGEEGLNILYYRDRTLASKGLQSLNPDLRTIIQTSREKLLERQLNRTPPGFDEKVLTAWNGLAISAFSLGYKVTGEKRYLVAAEKAARFLMDRLYDPQSGTLFRYFRDGKVSTNAFVDDYAFLVQGLLDLYEASLVDDWMTWAKQLHKKQLELFWDTQFGGFFNSSVADNRNFIRMKEIFDVEPSPNAVSALNILRFSSLTRDSKARKNLEKLFAAFSYRLQKPNQMPQLKSALSVYLSQTKQIIIAGDREDPLTQKLVRQVNRRFLPNKVFLLADGGSLHRSLSSELEFLSQMKKIGGKATAYVCENYLCRMPTSDPELLSEILEK